MIKRLNIEQIYDLPDLSLLKANLGHDLLHGLNEVLYGSRNQRRLPNPFIHLVSPGMPHVPYVLAFDKR